ncbi:F-box protein At3g07870-like [Papaver somniferum]|uniref:F-box protein At3g07870-like n=1 Tax=Papaver somniferum TaxID=3469 RepID=UPI000E703BE6|nr:F-box protein At3g07870-like [Papaver somniferum]
MGETTLHDLPREKITEILTRLPSEYAIEGKEVCKTWKNILHHIKREKKINLLFEGEYVLPGRTQLYYGEYDEKSSKTIQEQLSYDALTPLGYPDFHYTNRLIVGSHRGLVCFVMNNKDLGEQFDYDDPIFICNPFTKETVRLPPPPRKLVSLPKDEKKVWDDDFSVIGFGYLYSTNEYKIVRIYYDENSRKYYKKNSSKFCKGQIQVYTLGGKRGGWRNIGITNHYFFKYDFANGILFDGALHWVTYFGSEIVAFHLADEKFRSVRIPPRVGKGGYQSARLLLLGGNLSIALMKHPPRNATSVDRTSTDIWSFKPMKDHKLEGSYEFTIHAKECHPSICYPFALKEVNTNKVLLWHMGRGPTLGHYDTETGSLDEFADERLSISSDSVHEERCFIKSTGA